MATHYHSQPVTEDVVQSRSVSYEDNQQRTEQLQTNDHETESDLKLDEHSQEIGITDTDIDIKNPANKIEEPYEYCSEKIFKTIPRLLLVLTTSTCILILGNLDKFKSDSTNVLISIFAVICSIIVILCSVGILVYKWKTVPTILAENPDYKPAKRKGNLTVAEIHRQILYDEVNKIFGIVREQGICSVDRTKFGVTLLGFTIYSSINIMLIEGIFPLESNVDCQSQEALDDLWIHGKCAVNQSSFSMAYQFVYAIVVTVLSYYHIPQKCYDEMQKKREIVQNKIKGTKIAHCVDGVEEAMQKWSKKQSRQERKFEVIVLFITCFVYHFGPYGIVRNNIFGGGINGGAVVFCLYLYIGDAVVFTMILFIVHEHLLYFYSFPKLIMQQLAYQFKAESIHDIALWWEFRKYYLYCVIQIYAAGMSGTIFGALIGASITAVFWILTRKSWEFIVSFMFLFWTIYLMFGAFIIVSHAVNYHLKQLSHVHTVNKERLRLCTLKYYVSKKQMNKDDEMTNKLYEIILRDIKENDQPILVFGVSMNSEFMLFLRASVLTISIAAYFGG